MSPLLNTADAIRLGSQRVDRVYLGNNWVWPIKISGLCFWLDAATLPQGALSGWWPPALPGSGHGGVLTGPGQVPVCYGGGPNGLNFVRFWYGNGMVYSINVGDAAGAAFDRNFTVFIVAHMWGSTKRRILSSYYPTYGNVLVGWWGGQQDVMFVEGWPSGWPGSQPTATLDWKLYSADGVAATNTCRLFSNGVYIGGLTNSPNAWRNAIVVSGGLGFDESSDCDVGELICFNRTLTDAERQQVEAYLRRKWGF